MENTCFSSSPEEGRKTLESQGLCFFRIEDYQENDDRPDCDAEVRTFLANVLGQSFDDYTVESWPLKCASDTNGVNILEDTRQDLIAHCDGILMKNPPKWICIFKTCQTNMRGDDISLLGSDDLINELGKRGVSVEQLLATKFPYNFPKFHREYREDREPRWLPFLKKDDGKFLTCYAPDVILKELLNKEQRVLLEKIEGVILSLQKKKAMELPVGSGYLVSNERYLHGRNALSLIDTTEGGKRSVFRIRLYS